MAVAFTGASSADLSASGASSTVTISSYAASTGDLIIAFAGTVDPFDADTVSGVTWNGIAMTQAIALKGAAGDPGDWMAASIWYLQVSSGATGNVVATWTGSITEGSLSAIRATGFNTGAVVGDTDSGEQGVNNASHSKTFTTTSGDGVVFFCVSNDGTDDHVDAQAGQTSIYNSFATYGGNGYGASASYKVASGSSTTLGVDFLNQLSLSLSNENIVVGIVIQQASSGAAISAANTLGAATSAATVKARAGITSAKTLGAATSAATVKARAGITSAKTLGTLTSAATAGGPRQITAAMTLGQLGSSASMLLINPSQANNTLGQLTSAATVKAIGTITSSKTLGSLTSVAGINVNTLSAANTLGALTSSASANGIASISSAKTLGTLTAAAFIAPNSIITGSPTLDAMVSQAVIAHGHVMRPTWTRKPSHSATWTRRA